MPLPLLLAGLASGALQLARNPVVRRTVSGAVKGLLSGLTGAPAAAKRVTIPRVYRPRRRVTRKKGLLEEILG